MWIEGVWGPKFIPSAHQRRNSALFSDWAWHSYLRYNAGYYKKTYISKIGSSLSSVSFQTSRHLNWLQIWELILSGESCCLYRKQKTKKPYSSNSLRKKNILVWHFIPLTTVVQLGGNPPLPKKLPKQTYFKCQKKKCPILWLVSAFLSKNLTSRLSKYCSYFRTYLWVRRNENLEL